MSVDRDNTPPATHTPTSSPPLDLASEPSALKRRGLALLLPLLATCTGALVPATVDTVKLALREPGFSTVQVIQSGAFMFGLMSMLGAFAGLLLGLLLMILTRDRDLSRSARLVVRTAWGWLKENNSRQTTVAAAYASLCGFALLLAAGYKVNHLFFTTFKNQQLAALLLACLVPVLLCVIALATLTIRVGMLHVISWMRMVPVARLLGTLSGAAVSTLLGVTAGTLFLVFKYLPIVRMIDWRPMSYPSLTLGGAAVALALVLWGRDWRLERSRSPGVLRHAALGIWCAIFLAIWGYCLTSLGDHATVRTGILRRFGAARSFDVLSRILDFDRDGYLSFFGGGDCAPFNSGVHPGASEIPGNGVDDNCFGGDLSAKEIGTPKKKFDHKLPPPLDTAKLNFVLITMDGLRADHIGAYGYKEPTTPHLDKFAKRCVLFERAYTQAPSTRYSIPSFLSSRYSSQIPRKSVLTIPKPILPGALLMAEIFKEAGYYTGAALSYHVFNRSWGMDQGFDFYDNTQAAFYHGKGRPGWDDKQPYLLIDVAKKFLESTKTKGKPFMFWIHVYEPHPPYVERKKPIDFGDGIKGLYDGELRFGDGKVKQILDLIAKHPQADRTVIALSADHGRGLGEHGASSHGYDLFVEKLHVPLMFHVPGLKARRIKNPVAMLDLLPTMVNLARIKKQFQFEGRSLVPQLVEGVEPPPDRPIFSEVQVGFHNSHFINAITTRDFKLIYDVSYNTYQLYDLRKDPGELVDVADKHPADLKRLKGLLYKVMERATMPGMTEEIRSSIVKKAPVTPGIKKINFGNKIKFLGFEVHPERPSAGQIMTVTWYIKALAKIKKDYKVIVRFKGKKASGFDGKHVPVRGQYPTSKWKPGQIVRDRQYMRLPRTVAQDWEVWVGFGVGHDYLKPVDKVKLVNTAVNVGTLTTY